jgi:hypothetical protein
MFVALPTLNLIARSGYDPVTRTTDSHTTGLLWAGIVFILSMSRIAYLAYRYVCYGLDLVLVFSLGCFACSLSMMLAKEYTPNPASLGVTNGLYVLFLSLFVSDTTRRTRTIFDVSVACR